MLSLALAGLVGIAPTDLPRESPPPPPRNVVLIVADDLGRTLGCYGDPVARTPRVDELARRGTRFTDAYATVASCSASRAVIYTGLYTHTNGQFGHAHAPAELHTHANVQGLPKILKAAGYRSGIVGKFHVLPEEVYPFDVQLSFNRAVEPLNQHVRRFFSESSDQPFLLVVGFQDPHRSGKGFGNETIRDDADEVRYNPGDLPVPPFLPDRPEVRDELAEYYQATSRMDRGVGLILDALRESGRQDETLVIFLSDNGIPFPGAKTTLYDPGVRLPLIVASPSQQRRGVVNRAMVSWIDIVPTILDWAGVKAPYPLPGRSILPILEQDDPAGWDVVHGSFVFHEITNYYPMRMIRTRTHKLIRNLAHPLDFPFASDLYASKTWQGVLKRGDRMYGARTVENYVRRPVEELYDLRNDPNETRNLAADPASAEVLKDLRARLRAWQRDTQDPWIVKYEYE
jgi:N-sulfoglucosamine sulfohydrolase